MEGKSDALALSREPSINPLTANQLRGAPFIDFGAAAMLV